MIPTKRVFILGAGFSKPAGMPLATELFSHLVQKRVTDDENDEMGEWLEGLAERLAWLAGNDRKTDSFNMNIEEVFHCANFDIEVFRLSQHLTPVGRQDGPGTPWNVAESIEYWLSYLEYVLCDVILKKENRADLAPIIRWAETIDTGDAVITFNYDTLVERTLTELGKTFNHGMGRENDDGIAVFKLHGSIDWIVAHRAESFSKLDLLFEKKNMNQSEQNTGHVEDDYRLWRCRTRDQLQKWISGRDLQFVQKGASPKTVGIAGLGSYKQLHQIPGLGQVWTSGMRSLYQADVGIVVGFSMSDFDAMAQMQFAGVARKRWKEKRPLPVIVIDPFLNEKTKERYCRVFRSVDFNCSGHETVDWNRF
ncbi:MAG: hypothetical protein C4527_00090 [Candidatus Omnitrophota bacterium]|nr:MAG: hypothetical protein C4527_00090 [Candidatus Omnitrophota bacterium]